MYGLSVGARAAAPSDYIIYPSPSCQEQPLLSERVLHTTPIRQHFPLQSFTQKVIRPCTFAARAGSLLIRPNIACPIGEDCTWVRSCSLASASCPSACGEPLGGSSDGVTLGAASDGVTVLTLDVS